MRGAAYSLPIKITAVILSLLTCLICTASIFASAVFMSEGFYSQQQWNYYATSDCSSRTYFKAETAVYDYYEFYRRYLEEKNGDSQTDAAASAETSVRAMAMSTVSSMDETLWNYQTSYSAENSNFRFTLMQDDQIVPISTYNGEDYGLHQEYTFTYYDENQQSDRSVTIQCYVVEPLTANDEFQSSAYWYGFAFENRYSVLTMAVVTSLLLIALCAYLICAAGHKRGTDTVVAGGLHTVPFDLLTLMVITVASLLFAMLASWGGVSMGVVAEGIQASLWITAGFALSIFYVMSFAVRCKTHYLWKGTLIYRTYRWFKDRLLQFYHNRSFLWKAVLWVCLIGLLTFIVGSLCISDGNISFFFLYIAAAVILLGSMAVAFQLRYLRIQNGIRQMASGDLSARVNPNGLYGELKEQAENLNRINAAVQTAVEEQLKSERMKTELITNVSHDIKTPLTSIVNYVDLLKKQQIQDETAKEYIEVLERQSIRLKKLIEDLIDASKASTGNMTVNLEQLDMTELLKQVSGEYTDRLKAHQLELVLTTPEKEEPVLADGQLLWRVFDNLLSNAQKYSQPGTRVYLDLKEERGHVAITFRNISRYPLNITGDELMERFVRGDSSRHTEGSGLGLSIARSLTELMNGQFDLLVDGDLFKAQIVFIKLS